MTDSIGFGKYKGLGLSQLIETDMGYAKWLIKTQPKCMPRRTYDKLYQLINTHLEYTNPVINTAYYKSDLYKEFGIAYKTLFTERFKDIPTNILEKSFTDDAIDSFLRSDCCIAPDSKCNPWDLPSFEDFDKKFQPLKDLVVSQLEKDKVEKRPSRRLVNYWAHLSEFTPFIKRESGFNGTGKWLVYLNKIDEDIDGNTELDRCWNIIVKNAQSLFNFDTIQYSAKVSTMRPNPNSTNTNDGVIILYCSEKHKTAMITEFRKLYDYAKPIYWKSNDATFSNAYAKDGTKASSDVSYPEIRTVACTISHV